MVRQCAAIGIVAMVARKGDEESGAVLIKIFGGPQNCRVYAQVRDSQARLGWMCSTGPDPVADGAAEQAIAKAVAWDGDVWVLEIEDGGTQALGLLDNLLKV